MSEFCPLNSLEPGSEGVFWDTGIPEGCRQCFNAAYDNSVKKDEISIEAEEYREDFGDDYDFEMADRWACTGIKKISDIERLGIEEIGIDNCGDPGEYLINRSTFKFVCSKLLSNN